MVILLSTSSLMIPRGIETDLHGENDKRVDKYIYIYPEMYIFLQLKIRIENTNSIDSMVLTAESTITEIPKEEKPAPPPANLYVGMM